MLKQKILLLIISITGCIIISDTALKHFLPPAYDKNKYGWVQPEHTTKHHVTEDSPGVFRDITNQYFNHGFKRWGDIHTNKTKLLIIGDSYTDMIWVSNGEEWYSYLEKEFTNLELFVYGSGGYGSLQEYMILDDFIDLIKPDIILLQFCSNDIWNNLFDFDLWHYPGNNHAVRPYMENGQIVYRMPMPLYRWRERSFIIDRLMQIYDFAMHLSTENYIAFLESKKLARQKMTAIQKRRIKELENRGYELTNEIMAMIRKRAGNIPVYFMNISGEAAEDLAETNGFHLISGIKEYIDSQKAKGQHVTIVNNGHWNKLGNQLVGQKLIDFFNAKRVLETPAKLRPKINAAVNGALKNP